MLEKEIEKKLRDGVKKIGGRAYKFISPGNDGVPDRIVLLPGGRVIFIELKTDTGVLSKIQECQIKRLIELGQEVRVLYGINGVLDFLGEVGNES